MTDLNVMTFGQHRPEEALKSQVDLSPFFAPRSVAVIGASPRKGNLGKYIVQSLIHHRYPGTITTVHPKGEPVEQCPVVTQIDQLPNTVDLAIAAVSAPHVLPLLKPLAARGVHHLIIIGGGFAETGEAGEILQQQIQEEARRRHIRIIGPNGMGVFSAADHFNSFFLKPGAVDWPLPGTVALISQSGAFLMHLLDHLGHRGVGVHRAVNFGNRVDIGECELLEEFGNDPEVKVIGLYLESVQDGPRFLETVRSMDKPIFIFKGGKTEHGQRAALAHSASLAGAYAVFQAVCRQTGMIEVEGLEQMIDALQTFSRQPRARSNRVLVVSNGGGMGVLLTDLCEQAGLIVPPPSENDQGALRGRYPAFYSFRNPVDLTGSGTNEQCVSVVEYLLAGGEFDALLLVLLPGTEGINENIGPMLKDRLPDNLPVVIGAYGGLYEALNRHLGPKGIPVFPNGERAARGLELLVRHTRMDQKTYGKVEVPSFDPAPTKGWLKSFDRNPHEMQIKNLLNRCGIPVPQHFHLLKREDADCAADYLGFPLTLKVVGPAILHKTEMRAIRGEIHDRKTLITEWEILYSRWPGQVWAEQHMTEGLDLMVGAHRDPHFGPVLLFGTGGSYVELYADIARCVIPASLEEWHSCLRRTRVWKIIEGYRGKPPLNQNKLLAFLNWVADWMMQENEIQSLDFNPVRLYEKDLVVLDAKMTRLLH
ncbi:MAG: hypothetical protein GWM98_13870 [Nitrospinaceae bacterium]|nr:hypothetical protein [Nitrospinaceae bacterium]NIR55360.1 hypothetical protein [Nitrospinaceae bacterium]NIS85800.1 hypothetical protein [Nitrospinaceae bacterium]NIT82652.1 hypothetical protein [Nitrospinaceae bacterium]NIU44854.1 hypothetical protein [Nitrospinaceae bacterium]